MLYLIKILLLLIFSLFVGYNFYYAFPGHIQNFDGYFPYILTTLVIYGIYKYLQLNVPRKPKEIRVSFWTLLFLFFTNIFVLSFYYFSIIGSYPGSGFTLFIKVIGFLILPVSIFFIVTGFGKTLTDKFFNGEEIVKENTWLLDLVIGFISFVTLLTIFGLFGLYNKIILLLILVVFGILSYKNILYYFNKIKSLEIKCDKDIGSQIKFAIGEFFVFVAFLALGIGLISIVRPYPIGWDDLGVYMNFPHLLAEAGQLLSLGGMYPWQVFTGIGYMFNSATQAFFLNISGLVLTFIVLNTVLSSLLKGDKKTILPIPLILSVLFIILPMVMFQTTKDMKVDEGLFFISVIVLYYVYLYFMKLKEGKNTSLYLVLLIGIIVGFCFSIKLTSLLLILSILAVFTYGRLGGIGTLGYIGVFFGVFTIGKLWGLMQVNINPYNIASLELYSGLVLLGLGLILLAVGFFRNKNVISSYIKEVLVFLLGIVIILLPWFGRNIYDSYPNISINTLIYGTPKTMPLDLNSIYTGEEIENINEQIAKDNIKEGLVTTNEDLLRYIGYENGLLKYTNMFWNLTMQTNQEGEYTNIGFIFLALLPLIFIFLPYKNKYYFLFFVFLALFQFIYYSVSPGKYLEDSQLKKVDSEVIENFLSKDNDIFNDKPFNKDIYDINIKEYYTKDDLWNSIAGMENVQAEAQALYDKDISKVKKSKDYYLEEIVSTAYPAFEKQLTDTFYSELREMVINPDIGQEIQVFSMPLTNVHFEYIKYLNIKYLSNRKFSAGDIVEFRDSLNSANIIGENREELLKIWRESRTIPGKITDFFANINFPVGYIYLLLGFLIPVVYLTFTLKKTESNYLFKLNLVFAGLYVFLWLISSFGIVWYGITMYFSFLLMIGFGAYYISNYKDEDSKKFYFKLLGSLVFLLLILYHIFNSTIPYLFTNLKGSGLNAYKAGQYTNLESIFLSQPDYIVILFELNVSNDKRAEFFKENIDAKIYDGYKLEGTTDISPVIGLLRELERGEESTLKTEARRSLERVYNGILNPEDEHKNKENIYRIGTFLKYYVSENNYRFHEDSLLSFFHYYIQSDDIDVTIDRLKKLGFKYILLDLNTATIDNSLNHDLTNRYELFLETLTSDKLELIESDSICLRLGLELYKNNGDMGEFLTFASVNHNSYSPNGGGLVTISEKRAICVNRLNEIIENNMINEDSYSFLLGAKERLEGLKGDLNGLNNAIGTSYKAVFKIN